MKLDPVASFVVATCMASIAATTTVWLLAKAPDQGECDCQCPSDAMVLPIPTPVAPAPIEPGPDASGPVTSPQPVGESPERPPGLGEVEIRGTLSRDAIREVVREHIDEIRGCYNQGLTRNPALAGRVQIQFTIEASGSVPNAAVATSTLADDLVEQCITHSVMRWTFPRPEGGNVVVTYPFLLEPG